MAAMLVLSLFALLSPHGGLASREPSAKVQVAFYSEALVAASQRVRRSTPPLCTLWASCRSRTSPSSRSATRACSGQLTSAPLALPAAADFCVVGQSAD